MKTDFQTQLTLATIKALATIVAAALEATIKPSPTRFIFCICPSR